MKRLLPLLCLLAGLFFSLTATAQSAESVEYTERVPVDGYSAGTLHARAAEWADRRFAYGPKTNFQSNPAAGTVSVQGTVKLKPVDAKGQNLERVARFDFTFQTNEQGYSYSVAAFRVIPDPQQLDQSISLDEYLAQLAADKHNERTKNAQRVRAQANSLASDIALSFRSHMNSLPTAEDGSVGLPANDKQ